MNGSGVVGIRGGTEKVSTSTNIISFMPTRKVWPNPYRFLWNSYMSSALCSDPLKWNSLKSDKIYGKCRWKFVYPPMKSMAITSMNIAITQEVFVAVSCIKITNWAKIYKYTQNLIYTLNMPSAGHIFTEFTFTQQHFVKTSIPNFMTTHQTVWSQILDHIQMNMGSPHKTFSCTHIKATFYFPILFVGLHGKWVIFILYCCFLCFWHISCFPQLPFSCIYCFSPRSFQKWWIEVSVYI